MKANSRWTSIQFGKKYVHACKECERLVDEADMLKMPEEHRTSYGLDVYVHYCNGSDTLCGKVGIK